MGTAETHSVVTDDGYILEIHRIPGNASSHGTPVLYLHGYESSSAEIVLRGKEDSLGFLMSNHGFDVWLINFRGNVYSRNHTVLLPDDHWGPFWNFTWWEMGTMDLPKVLKYVLESTGKTKLQIVGHSQGITALYVMLDQHPHLAANISLVSAMAPLAYNSHTLGMLKWCAQFLANLPLWASQSEFLAPSSGLQSITSKYCQENSTTQTACYDFLFFVTGFDLEQQDRSNLVTQLEHFPAGTSARTIVHFAQMIQQGGFQAFDWGEEENLKRYNSSQPAQVDLGKATPPMAIYVAPGNDYLAQPEDYSRLVEELPNVVRLHTVKYTKWNHMDFIIGVDAPRLLYPFIFEEMDSYLTTEL